MKMLKKQKGFTLIEIIIALAVIGVAISGMLYYQSRADTSQKVNDTTSAITTMVGSIKTTFAPANSYADVTAQNLINAGLLVSPFTASGANIVDPWGINIVVGGNASFFGFTLTPPDAETCAKLATALVRNAARMTIAADAAIAPAGTTLATFVTGATVIKADQAAQMNAANMATGCAVNNRLLAVAFR